VVKIGQEFTPQFQAQFQAPAKQQKKVPLNRNYSPNFGDNSSRKERKNYKRRFRRIVVLVAALFIFSGVLYGTYSFVRGRGISIGSVFGWRSEGVATSNMNLRPEPNARKDAIGFVPKDSRLRIVNSADNWYEVDVVEYGHPKQNADDADHGWVNKQYVDLR
jgi:hypothetical protein